MGIGAIIAALVSLIALVFTIRQNNNVKYLEFIKNVDEEFSNHLEKENSLKDREECLVYAYNYIDICDRILFLIKRHKVPQEFYDYYLDFFNYAITIMWWYSKIYPEDKHSLETSWPSITQWIYEKKGTPYPFMHLPKVMKDQLDGKGVDENSIFKELKKILKSE